jgi:arginine decarboxylase-like protein
LTGDGASLVIELDEKIKTLNDALLSYRKRGEFFAAARRDYQVALAKEMLIQRAEGLPVTIIPDICRGKLEIANMRFEKDVAEARYKSAYEAILCIKIQVRILENQIKQDWGNST